MTIADIIEHWAQIYKPISHNPQRDSKDKAFWLIRLLDKESTFGRNYNTAKSPCVAYSLLVAGKMEGTKKISLAHQVWIMMKVERTLEKNGAHDETQTMDVHMQMQEIAEDLITYLAQLKSTSVCPITGTDYRSDRQLSEQLRAIDFNDVELGSIPELFLGKWAIFGVDFNTIKPISQCIPNTKYITQTTQTTDDDE